MSFVTRVFPSLFWVLCISLTDAQNAPTCTNSYIEITVSEPSTFGALLHNLTAAPDCSDPDGGDISYTIFSGGSSNRFFISGDSFLVDMGVLDAEAKDGSGNYESPYKIIVQATDSTDSLNAYISLLVDVQSINDNDPVITLSQSTVTFTESTAVGTTISTCALSDADYPGGLDASVSVSIESGNEDGTFVIDSETCQIILVKSLNYDLNATYSLTLNVTDLDPMDPRSTTQVLTVNVQDENDVEPTCPFYNTMEAIDENTSGTIATLACSDVDALPLVYTKHSGDSNVKVDLSGVISIDSPGPDYDTGDRNLAIQVKVTDSGNPLFSTTVTYSLSVVDVDDNIPVFNPNTYTATVAESVNLGEVVVTLTASDADPVNTDNSLITYGFETPCSEDWFDLDTSAGLLIVKTAPVYATASSVTCQVFAYSSTLSNSTDVANITIDIVETNANAPVFDQNLYEATVSESDIVGTSVITVNASDADGTNAGIVYSLGTTSLFTIDASSGEVTIANTLNYDTSNSHLVLVRATDQGSPARSGEAYLSIAVQPVNQHDPVVAAVADQSVSENTAPGTLITTIVATDSDSGLDGQIEFTLADTTQPFIIETETGALRVGENLNREAVATYDVVVVATDQSLTSPRSSSSTVTVNILDVNDNTPDCSSLGPILVTPSNTNIGDAIGQLTCSDGDSGTSLHYTETSGDTNNIFQIDASNGEIRLQTAFVYGTYSYLVTVSDGGSPAQTTVFPVEILVEEDLNFAALPDTAVIAENYPIADIVYNVTATGAYDLITYSIESGNSAGKFSIHPSLGQVRLVSSLDRETMGNYALIIRATTTNGQTLDETLSIVVSDVNDNTPTYPNSFTNVSFVESLSTPSTLATLVATDADLGVNALIQYAIVSGNTDNLFTYDANGNLILSTPADYETAQYYELILSATDRGSSALTGTTLVYVTVQNANDNVLTITPSSGTVSLTLPEDTAVGDTVVQVNANDADLDTDLSYGFVFGNDFGYLSVNPNIGTVYLVQALDRESLASLTVGVEINSTQSESATVTLSITISDVNDNDPSFNLGNYAFEVPNNTTAGTDVGTLTVSDSDVTSPNNAVTLSIESGDTNARFSFNGQTLQAASTLSADTQNLYNLVVIAVDGGTPARTSTAYVTVHVAAAFNQPSFVPDSASITVEETRVPGSIIFDSDATASGAQETPTGDLQYTISSGNGDSKFYIEEYTGAIQLLQYLSYATTTSYTLVILAVNKNQPNTLSDLFTLNIAVTQVNIYDPVFTEGTYTWTISEGAAIGTQVGTLSATDSDPGNYGTVSYALESTSTFIVDSSTGSVTLNSALEYSVAKSYNFFVTATDNAGNSSRTSTAVVVITVTDVNNHVPSFSGSSYSATVPETATTGTTFFVMKATDLDSGAFGTVTYSIVLGNADSRFTIESSTGALSVANALDYETTTQYILTIYGSDGGSPSLTGTASVTVNVLDQNDNAPAFSSTRLDLRVGSDLAALSTVTTLTASDIDTAGTDGDFNYVIQSGNDAGLFSIDTVTGEIKTTQAVDTDTGYYNLVVVAVDQGLRALTGTVTVGISIQLVTSPGTGDYDFSVPENQDAGTEVGTIPADGSLNITSYTITGGNYDTSFSITTNANQEGVLATTKSLDRETYAYYQLQVDVNHSTGVKAVTVIVEVTDRNDNAPKANPDTQEVTIVENLPVGEVIMTFTASDADEAVDNAIVYTLSERTPLGPVFFAIDSSTGEISINKQISYEVFDFIRFRVRMVDRGGAGRTSTGTVEVTITDVAETVTFIEMDTTSFIPVDFPYTLKHNEVAYTLSPSDFNVTTVSGDTVTYLTVDYGVFNVDSSTGAMSLYLPERIQEVSTIKQWVVMTVKSGTSTTAYSGLVRLDAFNMDKHLIAVVASTDEIDLASQQSTLQEHLQTFYTSPNLLKIWKTEATTQALTRRRLLNTESVALSLVLSDSASDTFAQIDQFKTYLEQAAALAPLQASSDGTPASNVSGQPVAISTVLAFVSGEWPVNDDTSSSNSLDPAVIALIVVAAIATITAVIGIFVLAYYCCGYCERRRRRYREDRKRLIDEMKEKQKKKFESIEEEPIVEENLGSAEKKISTSSSDFSIGTESRKPIHTIEEIEEVDEEKVPPESFLAPYHSDNRVRFAEPDEHRDDSDSEPKEDNMPKYEQGSQISFDNGHNRGHMASTSTLNTSPHFSESTISLNIISPDQPDSSKPTVPAFLKPDTPSSRPASRSPSPSRPKRISVSPAPKQKHTLAAPTQRVRKVSPLANPDGDGVPESARATAKFVSSKAAPPANVDNQ